MNNNSEILAIINSSRSEMSHIIPIFENLYALLTEYKLPYLVSYGTLLGTILYNDFIPWDDDIDLIINNEDIEFIEKFFKNKYQLVKKYPDLFFLYDTNTNKKLDLFIAQNSIFNNFYNTKNTAHSKLSGKNVSIPSNYKTILDLTYGNDWTDIAYITNHYWSKSKLNSDIAFDKKYKDIYYKIPVSTVKRYLSENKIKVDRPV